jgi:hypothetical protein
MRWLARAMAEVLQGVKDVVAAVADMGTNRATVLPILAARDYSGKLSIQIPKDMHRSVLIPDGGEAIISVNGTTIC